MKIRFLENSLGCNTISDQALLFIFSLFWLTSVSQTTTPGNVTITSQDISSEVNDGYCYEGKRDIIRPADPKISSEKWVEIDTQGNKNQGVEPRKAKSISIGKMGACHLPD